MHEEVPSQCRRRAVGWGVNEMPLSEHEQRILAELEESLVRQDPEFCRTCPLRTVYRHAGRYLKGAAVGFVAGLAILVAFYSQSIFVGLLGVAMMFGSAVIFERTCVGWARPGGPTSPAPSTRTSRRARPGGSRRRCTGPGTGSAPVSCDAIADPVRAVDQAVLAVDIGGTKMGAAVVWPDGTLTSRRQSPTPRGRAPRSSSPS